jgi:hypothetical protein
MILPKYSFILYAPNSPERSRRHRNAYGNHMRDMPSMEPVVVPLAHFLAIFILDLFISSVPSPLPLAPFTPSHPHFSGGLN